MFRAAVIALIVASFLRSPTHAEASEKFTLAKAVPADCCVYMHSVDNPEREFLDKHWSVVFDALKSAGVELEIKKLLQQGIDNEQDRAAFVARWDRFMTLFKSIKWADLAEQEFVVVQRFSNESPEQAVLLRPRKETLEENVRQLSLLMQDLAGLVDAFRYEPSEEGPVKTWTVHLGDAAPPGWALQLFQHQDCVGLSSSPVLSGDVVELLSGGRKGSALVETARFKEALAQLPPAEDAIQFVDFKRLLADLRRMVLPRIEAQVAPADEPEPWVKLAGNVFDQFAFLEYVASTAQTEELRTLNHSVTRLTPDAGSKPLARALTARKPLGSPLKYVPREATGYFAWSGMDMDTLYSAVLDFVSENFKEGPAWIARWTERQKAMNFSIKNDLLSWLDGQMISFSVPPVVQSPFASSDTVLLLRTRDGAKALEVINAQFERFSQKQPLTAPSQDVNAEGFRAITHPMVMMLGTRPVYGVFDEWLVLGSSSAAVNKCLATAGGEAPSFKENDRFQREGLAPGDDTVLASFKDQTRTAQETAMVLGMVLPMVAGQIPDEPGTRPLRAIVNVMVKLAPVAAKIDFIRSTSTVCAFKGDRWITTQCTNYREYIEKKKPAEAQKLEGL